MITDWPKLGVTGDDDDTILQIDGFEWSFEVNKMVGVNLTIEDDDESGTIKEAEEMVGLNVDGLMAESADLK